MTRRRSWHRTLRRGIGEMGVIVAGVLMALWVDAWREDLAQRRLAAEYVERVRQDLEANLSTLGTAVRWTKNSLRATEHLLPSFEAASFLAVDSLGFLTDLYQVTRLSLAPLNMSSYEELRTSEGLSAVTSAETRAALASYFNDAQSPSLILGLIPEAFRVRVRRTLPPDVQLAVQSACELAPIEPVPCHPSGLLPGVAWPSVEQLVSQQDAAGDLRHLSVQLAHSARNLEAEVRRAEELLAKLGAAGQ